MDVTLMETTVAELAGVSAGLGMVIDGHADITTWSDTSPEQTHRVTMGSRLRAGDAVWRVVALHGPHGALGSVVVRRQYDPRMDPLVQSTHYRLAPEGLVQDRGGVSRRVVPPSTPQEHWLRRAGAIEGWLVLYSEYRHSGDRWAYLHAIEPDTLECACEITLDEHGRYLVDRDTHRFAAFYPATWGGSVPERWRTWSLMDWMEVPSGAPSAGATPLVELLPLVPAS